MWCDGRWLPIAVRRWARHVVPSRLPLNRHSPVYVPHGLPARLLPGDGGRAAGSTAPAGRSERKWTHSLCSEWRGLSGEMGQIHKSHNAPASYPTMHHFMNRSVHICVPAMGYVTGYPTNLVNSCCINNIYCYYLAIYLQRFTMYPAHDDGS